MDQRTTLYGEVTSVRRTNKGNGVIVSLGDQKVGFFEEDLIQKLRTYLADRQPLKIECRKSGPYLNALTVASIDHIPDQRHKEAFQLSGRPTGLKGSQDKGYHLLVSNYSGQFEIAMPPKVAEAVIHQLGEKIITAVVDRMMFDIDQRGDVQKKKAQAADCLARFKAGAAQDPDLLKNLTQSLKPAFDQNWNKDLEVEKDLTFLLKRSYIQLNGEVQDKTCTVKGWLLKVNEYEKKEKAVQQAFDDDYRTPGTRDRDSPQARRAEGFTGKDPGAHRYPRGHDLPESTEPHKPKQPVTARGKGRR